MLLTHDLHIRNTDPRIFEYTQKEQCLQQPNINFHYSHNSSKLGIRQQ